MPDNTEPLPAVQPQSIVTLRIADERDKTMWVTERPSMVLAMIQDARDGRGQEAPMIALTRWRAMSTSRFLTRFDNVVSVEPYR
jgi:hypothetical protein